MLHYGYNAKNELPGNGFLLNPSGLHCRILSLYPVKGCFESERNSAGQ
ncbi:MAG: hypothetical protein IKU70_12695 [Clostridia bacterium]|nr:hypothetical protein [Clostridia bacterium]